MILSALLGACAVPAAPVATAPTAAPASPGLESVRVAHVPSTLFAPLYVALENGYFREQGIAPQLEVVTAGQDAMALAGQRHLDAVVGGFAAGTFNALERGLDIRVVGSMGTQPQIGFPSALMVRADLLDSRQVTSLADLRGRKVALAGGAGSTGSYWMATKLREGSLGLRDVDIVNLSFADMVAGFRSGAIDAALPAAPFTAEILRDKTASIFGGPIRPGASAVGTLYGPSLLQERRATGDRFFAALVRGAREVRGERYYSETNLQTFAKYTGLSVDVLQEMDRYEFDPDLRPDTETLMDMQRLFLEGGLLRYADQLPAERVVDDAYSRAAAARLGSARP
jgi:NitT/TauT family transport system substrate-binding protein